MTSLIINASSQGTSTLSRSFRTLSYDNFKDGVRMANQSILAIKKIAEEQSELMNAISDNDDDDDDDDNDDNDNDATRDYTMTPMFEFNKVDIASASSSSRHTRTKINSSRPSTSINDSMVSSSTQKQSKVFIANDDRDSTVSDNPSIYEYLQPKTSMVVTNVIKSQNPFYRPNTTAGTDPHPNIADPSMIKELGLPLKSEYVI